MGRYIGLLKSVHLRHDNPRLFPGWTLDQVEVFVAAEGTQAPQLSPNNKTTMTRAVSMRATSVPPFSAEASLGVDAGGRPRLYRCLVDLSAPLDAWPSAEVPYIRHYATLEAEKFSETPAR